MIFGQWRDVHVHVHVSTGIIMYAHMYSIHQCTVFTLMYVCLCVQDYAIALDYFQKAADKGSAEAQYFLGHMFYGEPHHTYSHSTYPSGAHPATRLYVHVYTWKYMCIAH